MSFVPKVQNKQSSRDMKEKEKLPQIKRAESASRAESREVRKQVMKKLR